MGQHGSKTSTGQRKRTQNDWDTLMSDNRISECSSESDDTSHALRRRSRNAYLGEKPIQVQAGRLNRVFKYFRRKISRKESISSENTGTISTDIPDCSSNQPFRPIVKSLDELVLCTRFSRHELQQMYRGFKNDCPKGYVTWDKFKKIYSELFPCGDSSLYARFIFNTFDSDHDGRITFEEFATGLSSSMRGTLNEKLKWSFRLYDIDNDGVLTKEELVEVLDAVYKMIPLPVSASSPALSVCICGDPVIEEQAEDIFKAMDSNGDGFVNEEEFIAACLADPSIIKSLAFAVDSESIVDELNEIFINTRDQQTRPYSTSSQLPRKFTDNLSLSAKYKKLDRINSLPILKKL